MNSGYYYDGASDNRTISEYKNDEIKLRMEIQRLKMEIYETEKNKNDKFLRETHKLELLDKFLESLCENEKLQNEIERLTKMLSEFSKGSLPNSSNFFKKTSYE